MVSLAVSGICNSVKNKGEGHTKIVTRELGTSAFLKRHNVTSGDTKNTDRRGGSSCQELCRVLGVMNESTRHVWVGLPAEEANVTQDEQTGNCVC